VAKAGSFKEVLKIWHELGRSSEGIGCTTPGEAQVGILPFGRYFNGSRSRFIASIVSKIVPFSP
jgi:hypothetical protein